MNHSKLEGIATILLMLFVFSFIANFIQYKLLSNAHDEIENLNNTVEEVVQMHNDKNHELNDVKAENEALRDANEALIKHATPSSVKRAIIATKLPSMEG